MPEPDSIETIGAPNRFIPLPAWPSLLSLDAMLVALAWQQLLMRSFCSRPANWHESVSLGATVWLIYVADRLLDAARLDLARPHTLRHRFYQRHSRVFLTLWFVVLAIDTFVVVRYLSPVQLQCGLVLASAVLAYGADLHFFKGAGDRSNAEQARRRLSRWLSIPKEVRVGTLFALGVSLTVWTQFIQVWETGEGSLAADWATFLMLAGATCMMAVLFCCNCILVARFERELDRAQSFSSISTERATAERATIKKGAKPPRVSEGMATGFAIVTLFPFSILSLQLPRTILVAAIASAVGLSVSLVLPNQAVSISSESLARFDVRSAWVDAVLWLPPVLVFYLS